MMRNRLPSDARTVVALVAAALCSVALAQTKWDLPTAYPPSNFHTENIAQFVAGPRQGDQREAQDHRAQQRSLFKAHEIKREVQGNQAQMGEILISGYANEDPLFGVDSVPFLATSYADAQKLWKASRKALDDRFDKQGLKILYAVPWPPQGIYSNKPINSAADMKGLKMRTYNPATSRVAELLGCTTGHDSDGGAGAGDGHRSGQRRTSPPRPPAMTRRRGSR